MCPGLAINLRLDQGRLDVAGTDGIAGDALFGSLQCRDFGQPDNSMLGSDIR